jgi:hypothetical protein
MMVGYTLCSVFDLAHAQIVFLLQDGGKHKVSLHDFMYDDSDFKSASNRKY